MAVDYSDSFVVAYATRTLFTSFYEQLRIPISHGRSTVSRLLVILAGSNVTGSWDVAGLWYLKLWMCFCWQPCGSGGLTAVQSLFDGLHIVDSLMSEWLNERLTEWVNERMSKWLSEWMNEWVNDWVSEWTNDWTREWLKEWIAE